VFSPRRFQFLQIQPAETGDSRGGAPIFASIFPEFRRAAISFFFVLILFIFLRNHLIRILFSVPEMLMSNFRIKHLGEAIQASVSHFLRFLQAGYGFHPVYAVSSCSSADSGPSRDILKRPRCGILFRGMLPPQGPHFR